MGPQTRQPAGTGRPCREDQKQPPKTTWHDSKPHADQEHRSQGHSEPHDESSDLSKHVRP